MRGTDITRVLEALPIMMEDDPNRNRYPQGFNAGLAACRAAIARLRTYRIDWTRPIETDEPKPRPARLMMLPHTTGELRIVSIGTGTEQYWYGPEGDAEKSAPRLRNVRSEHEAALLDIWTHRKSWRDMLAFALMRTDSDSDEDYYSHELAAFDRFVAAMEKEVGL